MTAKSMRLMSRLWRGSNRFSGMIIRHAVSVVGALARGDRTARAVWGSWPRFPLQLIKRPYGP
jgi:hypothetical protein